MEENPTTPDDGLTYDDEGYLVYTGLSPLSEESDVADEEE